MAQKSWRVILGTVVEAETREEAWALARRLQRKLDPEGEYLDTGPVAVSENMNWPW